MTILVDLYSIWYNESYNKNYLAHGVLESCMICHNKSENGVQLGSVTFWNVAYKENLKIVSHIFV
jgi:hypothetical protein